MPRFSDLPGYFVCPYRDGCPYLEGLPTGWVWENYQASSGTQNQYENLLKNLTEELDEATRLRRQNERHNEQLKAQLAALHRRQFKGRKAPAADLPETSAGTAPPKRGAPKGHPPWAAKSPGRSTASWK